MSYYYLSAMKYNVWISVDDNELPLEMPIIVKHRFGIEAIQFHNHAWRYWYTGNAVKLAVLDSMSHFMIPHI
jgi:3-methyladenine DNA glycosylase Mpg